MATVNAGRVSGAGLVAWRAAEAAALARGARVAACEAWVISCGTRLRSAERRYAAAKLGVDGVCSAQVVTNAREAVRSARSELDSANAALDLVSGAL
jgi:hypothetical protein